MEWDKDIIMPQDWRMCTKCTFSEKESDEIGDFQAKKYCCK